MACATAAGAHSPNKKKRNAGQTGNTSGDDGGTAGIIRNNSGQAMHRQCGSDDQDMFSGGEGDRMSAMNAAQHLTVGKVKHAGLGCSASSSPLAGQIDVR